MGLTWPPRGWPVPVHSCGRVVRPTGRPRRQTLPERSDRDRERWRGSTPVASSRERQRKLARAKMERQMARRATRARRNRQIQAGIVAGVVVLLVVLGSLWLGGA